MDLLTSLTANLDSALLSRLQFAFTISFHIIFPTITIGLSLFIAAMEGMWLKTGRARYLKIAKFWHKPFAITFGMGVVSGIVLSFQFGTNFSRFSEIVGPVLGPLLAYEVLTAFFLEAGFLGIMLFGWRRVSRRMHFAATLIVAVGTNISAFWILAANSWMQTPAGYEWLNGQLVASDWWAVIFNPSFPYRLVHMLLASYISAALLVVGVSAVHLLRTYRRQTAKTSLSLGLWVLTALVPLQILVGDFHGLNVLAHQPVKLAAMEGIWQDERGAGLRLFALPNEVAERNDLEVQIPKLASLILTHEWDGEIKGLSQVPADERPRVSVVFFSFRVMLLLGGLMLLLVLTGGYLRYRGRLYRHQAFLHACRWMIPSGVLATLAGWFVAETGRQPWLVQGLVRTVDVVSPLPAERVLWSLLLFVLVYGLLFSVYLYFMKKILFKSKSGRGPSPLPAQQIVQGEC